MNTKIYCNSTSLCNLKCSNDYSCASSEIYVGIDNNTKTSNTKFELICSGDYACNNVIIYAYSYESLIIECAGVNSCLQMKIHLYQESTNYTSIINCYQENICDGLYISTLSYSTQLNLYAFSESVVILIILLAIYLIIIM